ncbi:uncharacterized protein N7477_009978 [Penicillium maclennaniae]|uniref:uncharacterized protein n=1 Tax=Penicillium maclennaniae TaxID=1343394 RepID=UPI0025416C0E|nr:uncharacterized protein N7477_009978 [Penicillium maclennaniae]KAJ5662362.1 hypothetical protein N7477_009978 [Penicillium maclennaniae]
MGIEAKVLSFRIEGAHGQYYINYQIALVEVPASLSLHQAATFGVPFTTAQICLPRARGKENDLVLLLGATEAVGSAVVQMAGATGCKQVLTAA